MTPTQLLTKADKEFKRCKDRNECPDNSHLEEASGLKAQLEVFQMKFNELEQKFSIAKVQIRGQVRVINPVPDGNISHRGKVKQK